MVSHGVMTKSPLALATEALALGQRALPAYSARRSRHDFVLAQHFAALVLKEFLRTDYRGIVAILQDWSDLRELLGFRKKVPHFTTFQKAHQRLIKKGLSTLCSPPSLTALANSA